MFLVALAFPWHLKDSADLPGQKTTQQISSISTSKEEEEITDKRHYLGVLISEKELRSYVEEMFEQYGIVDQIPTAIAVATCESGWKINASSGISFGVFQFTTPTWKDFGKGDIWNPLKQIEITAKIVKKEGWGRWDCFTGKR